MGKKTRRTRRIDQFLRNLPTIRVKAAFLDQNIMKYTSRKRSLSSPLSLVVSLCKYANLSPGRGLLDIPMVSATLFLPI